MAGFKADFPEGDVLNRPLSRVPRYFPWQTIASERDTALCFLWAMRRIAQVTEQNTQQVLGSRDATPAQADHGAAAGGITPPWLPPELCRLVLERYERRIVICGSTLTFATPSNPFKVCARCKGIYYSSKEAQKAHWKTHKAVCGVVTPAEAKAIRKLKLPELFLKMRAMGDDFDHTVGALYAHLDRQLLKEYGLACEYGNHIHAFARAFLFAGQWKRERLWAAPGMMDYFLWKHKLYSPFVKKRLGAGFYHPFPSKDYIEAVYTREKAVSMRKLKEIDVPPDLDFSYHYFNMILATTVQARRSDNSIHDGRGAIRPGRLARLAWLRVFDLWTNPLVMQSVDDGLTPAPSVALTAVEMGTPATHPRPDDCIAPGLTIDGAAIAALEDAAHGMGKRYAFNLLALISAESRARWDAVGPVRRAHVAYTYVQMLSENQIDDDGDVADATEIVTRVLAAACGPDPATRATVWQAVIDTEVGPLGTQDHIKARFHWLLRKQKATADPINIYKEIEQWDQIQWPCSLKEGADPIRVDEKMRCLRLALHPAEFAEFDKMFGYKFGPKAHVTTSVATA